MATGATVEIPTAQVSLEQDWRFAELVARTWLEPSLVESYTRDPRAVLARFGLHLPAGVPAPTLPAVPEIELVIEDLDRITSRAKSTTDCFCFSPTGH